MDSPIEDLAPEELHRLERFTEQDRGRIALAVEYAKHMHEGQERIKGGPYFTHLIATAQILIDAFDADADTVIAGLLHDTIEDTPATLDDIETGFGPAVRFLVDTATLVGQGDGRPQIPDKHECARRTHEKVREMLRIDARGILVKAADRWHNLLTCEVTYPSSQRRNAQEALDFHVPILRERGYESQAVRLESLARAIVARVNAGRPSAR